MNAQTIEERERASFCFKWRNHLFPALSLHHFREELVKYRSNANAKMKTNCKQKAFAAGKLLTFPAKLRCVCSCAPSRTIQVLCSTGFQSTGTYWKQYAPTCATRSLYAADLEDYKSTGAINASRHSDWCARATNECKCQSSTASNDECVSDLIMHVIRCGPSLRII